MPTEIAHAMGMHAFSEYRPSSTVSALNRGAGYFRRQMEGDNRGRMSAVERLAADKPKYVKSPQVICSKQDPVGMFSSASEGSSESCSAESRKSTRGYSGKPHDENVDLNNTADVCHSPQGNSPPIPRRSSSKRQMRPDSLLIYRNNKSKSETVKCQSGEVSRGGLVRRLFPGSIKEKMLTSPDMSKAIIIKEDSDEIAKAPWPGSGRLVEAPVVSAHRPLNSLKATLLLPEGGQEGKRSGVHRSQSDISSRYSKSFSEFDTFFKYCGLEPEVIEDMGKDRFSAVSDDISFRIRSVSVATSDSGFTRHSGEDGLQEEELHEQVHNNSTSVIERNARIIKWLYSCKKAKEPKKVLQELA